MSKPPSQSAMNPTAEKSHFEQMRAVILRETGESLENVLQNLNKLNRNLEGMTAVGNEFSAVEALWSHFENVMAKPPDVSDEDKPTQHQDSQTTPARNTES